MKLSSGAGPARCCRSTPGSGPGRPPFRLPRAKRPMRVPPWDLRRRLLVVARAAEVAPVLGDAREVGLHLGRGHHVQPYEAEVLAHRRDAVGVRLLEALVRADVARAHRGRLLGDVHPMRLAEQREDAVRVVARDRLVVLLGQVAVHDRRLRALGRVVDRVGVLEPGGAVGELREARVALLVELAVGVEQRVHGQLVEQHDDDRRLRDAADRARARLVRERELRDRAAEQEQREEHERRRRQDVEERADRLRAQPQQRGRHADGDRSDDQHQVGRVDQLLQRLDSDQRHEAADQDDVRDAPRSPAGETDEQLEREQQRRRQHHEQHREGDDVEARGAACGEELGVVLQQVEERLGDREAPQHREVEVRPGGLLHEAALGAGLRLLHRSLGGAHPALGRA